MMFQTIVLTAHVLRGKAVFHGVLHIRLLNVIRKKMLLRESSSNDRNAQLKQVNFAAEIN